MNPTELEFQVQNTAAFIAADAVQVMMQSYEKDSDGAGGFSLAVFGPPRPVTVRLIPASDRVPEISTIDGVIAKPEFVLLAMPDSVVFRYDQFHWRGRLWEIAQLRGVPEYEIKGDVVRVA